MQIPYARHYKETKERETKYNIHAQAITLSGTHIKRKKMIEQIILCDLLKGVSMLNKTRQSYNHNWK